MNTSDYPLLDAYPPVTHYIGFVKANLDTIVEFCDDWLVPYGIPPAERFRAPVQEAIRRFAPSDKEQKLFIQCRSGWTALFRNIDDVPEGPIRNITSKLKLRGVVATYVPDSYDPKTYKGELGAVQLRIFEPFETFFMNCGRSISVINEGNRWRFDQGWKPLPFENLEAYKAKRIRDRFTIEMLIDYLHHLKIDAYSPDFYTDQCALYHPRKQTYFGKETRLNGRVIPEGEELIIKDRWIPENE